MNFYFVKTSILILSVLAFSIFSSCTTDKANIFEVGNACHSSIMSKDSIMFKDLFTSDTTFDHYSFSESWNKAIKVLNNEKMSLIKIDTLTFRSETEFLPDPDIVEIWEIRTKEMHLYYEQEDKFYVVEISFEKDSLTKEFTFNHLSFYDVEKECQYWTEKEYNSMKIKLVNFRWRMMRDGTTFQSGKVRLKNISNEEINSFKGKIKIKYQENQLLTYGKEVFTKTFEYNEKVYPGDIFEVEISGLRGFATEYEMTRDVIRVQYDNVDLDPKPFQFSFYCDKLEELKSEMD